MRWNSVSNKLSSISVLQIADVVSESKCSLCLVAAFCVRSVESFEDFWGVEEIYINRLEEGSSYLTDRMTIRILPMLTVQCHIKQSITQALFPVPFAGQLFVTLSINLSTDQGRSPDTAANCTQRTKNRVTINSLLLILLLVVVVVIANWLSLGCSRPYTSTDETPNNTFT